MKEHTETKTARYNTARKWLIFWTLFIGIGAVAGGLSMIIDPSGKALHMDAMLPFVQKLPFADVLFRDFLFSGFALLIVNGLTNLTAAVLHVPTELHVHGLLHLRPLPGSYRFYGMDASSPGGRKSER